MPSTVGIQIIRPGPGSCQPNTETAHHLSVMSICWVNITGRTGNQAMRWEEVLLGCGGKTGGAQGMGRNHGFLKGVKVGAFLEILQRHLGRSGASRLRAQREQRQDGDASWQVWG